MKNLGHRALLPEHYVLLEFSDKIANNLNLNETHEHAICFTEKSDAGII